MIQGANPTWKFTGDPSYLWAALGIDIVYVDDYVGGASHLDGVTTIDGGPSKVNNLFNDIYNRLFFLKDQSDVTANKGWLKNITVNASRALTIDDNGLIGVWTADLGSGQPDIVELTLPTRLEMTDAGNGYLLRTAAAPFLGPVGKGIPVFAIQGYQTTSAGVPLKITVAQPTVVAPGVDVDFQQAITIGPNTGQSIWLYAGEYAELHPIIIKDDATGTWFCNWTAKVHRSGYDRLGEYVQYPTGIVPLNTLRADNSSKTRAKYPRLWNALNSGSLTSALVAQGSKTNPKFGDGDGSTTFTLPNLATLEASLVNYCLYF